MSDLINGLSPQRVELTGFLEEFRIALEEEIRSARIDAFSHTVPLKAGRRIAKAGKSYQYLFHLRDNLNLPDDAPGDLFIPSRQPVEISIVAVDGMSIIINSKNDLGDYIPEARLLSDLTFLLRKLIERIEELSLAPNIVGERVLSNHDLTGKIKTNEQKDSELNESQNKALRSSLDRNITFIWGPPGTGKTKTIGKIGYQLFLNKRSLLMVSHTNIAIDQALMKIAELVDKQTLEEGKILRIGSPKIDVISKIYPNLLLDTHVERRSQELSKRLLSLREETEESKENLKKVMREKEIYEWFNVAKNDFREIGKQQETLEAKNVELINARNQYVELKNQSDYWEKRKNDSAKAIEDIKQLENIESEVNSLAVQDNKLTSEKKQIIDKLEMEEKLLHEINSTNWAIRLWRRLPTLEYQTEIVGQLKFDFSKLEKIQSINLNDLNLAKKKQKHLKEKLDKFKLDNEDHPDIVIKKYHEYKQNLNELLNFGKSLRNEVDELKNHLVNDIRYKLSVIQKLGFLYNENYVDDEIFQKMDESFQEVKAYVALIEIETVSQELETIIENIKSNEAEIAIIEDALTHIEELIISEADIVATTLTKAYLNDSVRSRRYDTIILDEASMAPIPAIWVASSLIENNAVIVGDPRQLPPIVTSSNKLAKEWLGEDIFSVALGEERPDNLIALNEQYRMHPVIADIPNNLFYDEPWKVRYSDQNYEKFRQWYNLDWVLDAPVILIDTGPLNAWVTSVPRGKGSSRLNFLSAMLCCEICEIILRKDRPRHEENGNERGVIIQCPYQPHAKFIKILLEDKDLRNDVEVGTIHSFQGSEADVVIFDLVNDEPHWRVNLFMPANDTNTKKLVNVGITRARRRLIVVGDFTYIGKMAKNAFLGNEFLPYLKKRFEVISALDVAPIDLLKRAENAKNLIYEGRIDNKSTQIIVTQDDFYPLLINDIDSANTRIVIYSPFITRNRLAELSIALRAARERGVNIFIVTKPLQERGKRVQPEYRYLEGSLREWGITIIHKRGMHEKLVIIDEKILWTGSLNPLSFSDTQEIMERRVSEVILQEYSKVIQMNTLIADFVEESPRCPICGSEMIASEGLHEPFYWRCIIDGCYTRNIDQPLIKGGVLVCSTCGGNVEYGQWGGKPAWRCVENKRHHQIVVKGHLKLPKMRTIIPTDEISKLEDYLGFVHSRKQLGMTINDI